MAPSKCVRALLLAGSAHAFQLPRECQASVPLTLSSYPDNYGKSVGAAVAVTAEWNAWAVFDNAVAEGAVAAEKFAVKNAIIQLYTKVPFLVPITGGPVVAGTIGLALGYMYNAYEHGEAYQKMVDNTRNDLNRLEHPFTSMMMAIMKMPVDESQLSERDAHAITCEIMEATDRFDSAVHNVIAEIQQEQINFNDCWMFCGDKIPKSVVRDLQDMRDKVDDLDDHYNALWQCGNGCSEYFMASWHTEVQDDTHQMCVDLHRAMCAFPGDQDFCNTYAQCGAVPSSLSLVELPMPETLAETPRVPSSSTSAGAQGIVAGCGAREAQSRQDVIQASKCMADRLNTHAETVGAAQDANSFAGLLFTILAIGALLVSVFLRQGKDFTSDGLPYFLFVILLMAAAFGAGWFGAQLHLEERIQVSLADTSTWLLTRVHDVARLEQMRANESSAGQESSSVSIPVLRNLLSVPEISEAPFQSERSILQQSILQPSTIAIAIASVYGCVQFWLLLTHVKSSTAVIGLDESPLLQRNLEAQVPVRPALAPRAAATDPRRVAAPLPFPQLPARANAQLVNA